MDLLQTLTDLGIGRNAITFFVSMLPVVELRGAIPIGVALGLTIWKAALISIVGNILPAPFIIAFIRVVLDWMAVKIRCMRKFVAWLEAKGTGKKAERTRKYEFWGLVLLVAIPLPGTGAWTGSLVAGLLDIRMKRALPAIVLGVLIAAAVISLATAGVITLLV